MNATTPHPTHIVLVVGVDLSEVSEHLLSQARDLVRSVELAELHVVHVVRPESLRERLTEPAYAEGVTARANAAAAHFELARMCESIVNGSRANWTVHTPVGRTADELTRVARNVGADVIVVEAHEHSRRPRVFHRSVIGRIAQMAPCSVLTIRPPRRAAASTAAA
jgi:nucleotide-binding universal stress UspA family protein